MSLSITDIPGIKVGTAQDLEAMTGCTVILTELGAVCGVDVRGGAPGTRETDLLNPVNTVEQVHAVVLSGGSAFGLAAAQGVAQYLEEKGIGLFTGKAVVPIVPAAVLFDLNVGDYKVRPNPQMGYEAAQNAGKDVPEGNWGAGAGATVGKLMGNDRCTKSGQGTAAVQMPNGLIVAALVAVNAFGDVVSPDSGQVIAGLRHESGQGFDSTIRLMKEMLGQTGAGNAGNTTIGVITTNAVLTKAQATKIAQNAHDGLARTIMPVHTAIDGDTIFTLATGQMAADVSLIGILAREVMETAVQRAVQQAESIGGILCARDIIQQQS